MKNIMPSRVNNDEPISDEHIRSAIRYLDPDNDSGKTEFATFFAGTVALMIWAILIWLLLFSNSI
jgi:hypothetical protein